MNNELTIGPMTVTALSEYNLSVSLVDIRRDPVKYPRISATKREDAIQKMARIVYAAFLYRNQSTTKEVVSFTATALVDEIMADTHFGLQTLSWAEIGMVIRRAVLGGGKELYGVSVSSLYSALVDYAKAEGNEACKKAWAVEINYHPQIEDLDNVPF